MTATPSPRIALLVGFLIPGGGHFYAGKNASGLAWFLAVSLLSFTGWWLVGPGFFTQYHLDFTIVGFPLAVPTAIPEIANFLETIAAQAWLGKAIPDTPLLSTAPIGFALTGIGGVLNAIAMSDAHWRCRTLGAEGARAGRGPLPATAAMMAFLIPGGGHWILGRRSKGWLAGGALLLTMLIGELLSHGTVLQRERDQYFWSGEVLLGLPAVTTGIVNSGIRVRGDLPLAELGLLCTTVAGLLNVLLILDAFATAERDLRAPRDAAAPSLGIAAPAKPESPVSA